MSKGIPKKRCIGCDEVIFNRLIHAKRCLECAEAKIVKDRKYYNNNRTKKMKGET